MGKELGSEMKTGAIAHSIEKPSLSILQFAADEFAAAIADPHSTTVKVHSPFCCTGL
jgi:hypothetical protein